MRAVVLTVDQRSSRTGEDLVPGVLESVATSDALRPFERTAGDEIQGLYTEPDAVVRAVATLLHADAWTIGIGIGEVEEPLPEHARAGRGPAYLHAREAVGRAKRSPVHLAVVGTPGYRAEQVESVLWLWAGVLGRRSDRGWEVAALVAEGLSHREVGERLGISQSAVSQRAQAAGLVEGRRAEKLAAELIAEALADTEAEED